jgi:DNA-binding SARP family transcriptional activator
LQAQIVQLRRTLGASAIVTSESGYALDISAADLDAARFEDLVAEGRRGDVSCTLGTVMAGSL